MQNKVIQASNPKKIKEKSNPQKENDEINQIITNKNEMIKYKSQELHNQNSPKNTSNTSNPSSSNNSKKNSTLGNTIKQIANNSGIKNKDGRKSYNSNFQSNRMEKYNNAQNIDKILINEKKIIYYNEDNFEINNSDKNNSKNKNTQKEKNDKNITKIKNLKKKTLDNILCESDSGH